RNGIFALIPIRRRSILSSAMPFSRRSRTHALSAARPGGCRVTSCSRTKLEISIPFTPVPGPRLLVKPGPRAFADEQLLAAAAIEVARQSGLSSVHLTFLSSDTAARLRALGFLTRTGQQFHWQNREYASFDDFLATLASRKRKAIRKE